MLAHTIITLSIRETGTAPWPTFRWQVTVDGRLVQREQHLSFVEAELLRALTRQYVGLFGANAPHPRLALEVQRALGVTLFNLWLNKAWQEIPPTAGRRTLVLDSSVASILNLPWHLLRPPGGNFLSLDPEWVFSYGASTNASWDRATGSYTDDPLRILYLADPWAHRSAHATSPSTTLQQICTRAPIRLEQATHTTFAELQQQVRLFQPHIVHLSNPSLFGRQCGTCPAVNQPAAQQCHQCGTSLDAQFIQPYVAFVDARGEPDLRAASSIRTILTGCPPPWLCLTSNPRGTQWPFAAVGRFCQELITARLPIAIGWAGAMTEAHVMQGLSRFYRAVAVGVPVDRALAHARQSLHRTAEGAAPAWAVPALYAAPPAVVERLRTPLPRSARA